MSEREYSKTRRGKGGDRPCLGDQVESTVPLGTSHEPVDTLQRTLGNRATCKAFTPRIREITPRLGEGGDRLEAEAGRAVEELAAGEGARPLLTRVEPRIQRFAAEEAPTPSGPVPEARAAPVAEASEATTTPTPVAGLIIDDTAVDTAPGQMRQSEFLAELRREVCRTTEAALAGTIWSGVGCPWIDSWFAYYGGRDSSAVERAIRRYAPEAAAAATAREYIRIITLRVCQAIEQWSSGGEVTPPEGLGTVPGTAGLLSRAGAALARGAGALARRVGGLFLKGRGGTPPQTADPEAVRGELGSGRSLEASVRARMESAFDSRFPNVRIHTDARAADLSDELGAKAFTVGRDIAFAPGEYRPGTPIGDALIAHELAHVVQQDGAEAVREREESSTGTLETEADSSAVQAVVSLWNKTRASGAELARTAFPRLKTGLRLQRCKKSQSGPLVIEHTTGSRYPVPGIPAGATEFTATGATLSLEAPGPRREEHPITGGFAESPSIAAGFGTLVSTPKSGEADELIRSAGDRIDPLLLAAVTAVTQDLYILRALRSFLRRDNGRLVALASGGHYDAKSPPTIQVGTDEGPLDTRKTLVHELLHYVFDKMDSVISEARDIGGADHPTIEALETRYLLIDLIRSGQSPLHETVGTMFGRFLASGDLFPQMQEAIARNDPERLSRIANQPTFVTTVVSSGLLATASGLALSDSSEQYRHTAEQFRDLAFLWAQNAMIVRRAMREAVNVSRQLGIPLNEVFATAEWKGAMGTFLNAFVTALKADPRQGVVGLEARL